MFLYKTCLPSLYSTFGIQCYGDGIEGEALNTIGLSIVVLVLQLNSILTAVYV